MDDTVKLISFHLSSYPGMEIQDCVKLLYQNEFGAAHIAGNEVTFLESLQREWDSFDLRSPEPDPPVPIGNGLCRVPLGALSEGPALDTFARLCLRSARNMSGTKERFEGKLAQLQGMIQAGKTPFCPEDMDGFLAKYREAGAGLLHHSERFKSLYQPHYRLMDAASALFLPVYRVIDGALASKPHVLAGIDGMSGAGKSRLSGALEEIYHCALVRTDDFFLREGQRSPARYALPGGNIDYERLAPVAEQAADDRAFSYRGYDCKRREMGVWRRLPEARLTLLEGVYALHPKVGALCDVRVFLGLDARRQRQRILERSGPGLMESFIRDWIPMENSYFAEYGIRESCDVILDTTSLDSSPF